MKPEIYSCLKMLETFSAKATNIHNVGGGDTSRYLYNEYNRIRSLLKKHLNKDQYDFIPELEDKDFRGYNSYDVAKLKRSWIMEIITACDVAKSFLKSLEMSLDKELIKQKAEMKLKQKELELKEKEIEHMQSLLSKSLKAIEKLPEVQRSKAVSDMKEYHRKIEQNTNPHTKSQNN